MAPDSGTQSAGHGMVDGKTTPLFTLPARWYHDPAIYEAERWGIFAATWQFIGHESDLPAPGDYVGAKIAGFRVFVLRDREGRLKAFHNVCPHRAAPLVGDGKGHCDVLQCRYHRWTFDHDGKLKVAPHFGEADWFNKEEHGLKPVRVDVWRDLIFVNIDGKAKPLVEFLGDVPALVEAYEMESFTKTDTADFQMDSNWKTYTDNFVEGYHIPGIHPGLIQAIDFNGFETTYQRNVIIMKAPQKSGSIYSGLWLWIWPNMTLSIFPDGMNTSRIVPHGTRSTSLHYSFYFRDASPEKEASRQSTIKTNCDIVREDFGICEDSQDNLEAGIYKRGPLSPKHELGVKYYHDEIRAALKSQGVSET